MFPRFLFVLALAGSAHTQSVRFQWAQQIGGSQTQSVAGVATDSSGNIYVAGTTASLDFPVKGAVQAAPGGSGLYRVDSSGRVQNLYSAGLSSVYSLTPDPTNVQAIYALSGKAVEYSTDSGNTWTNLSNVDPSPTSIAVDPSSSGRILYLGTSGNGVLKSTDGGATWNATGPGLAPDPQDGKSYAYGVWVDPNLPSVIFANTQKGVARSSDGGATWTYTTLNVLTNFSNLVFDPATPGVVYAATFYSVQKSTDDGVTWNALSGPTSQQFQLTTVLLDPAHPGTMFAGGYTGLWKSIDGGNTWAQKVGSQVFALAFGPGNALYFATGGYLYRSIDGLDNTARVGPVLPIVTTMAALPNVLFVGTQSGTDIFVSKFDPQGNLLYATYFGGSATDQATALASDSSGAVYVTGTTSSSDFPVSQNAYAQSGGSFLFKLNADGSLAYSTYFASAGNTPVAIAVDSAGSAYLTGVSYGNLPVTPGAYQTTFQGVTMCCNIIGPGLPLPSNGFVTKFDPSGRNLVFSTYFGSQSVIVSSIALATNGDVLLAGSRYLYRLSADGSSLPKNVTFPGIISALLSTPAGDVYAGGNTQSYITPVFPTTPGAFETAPFYPSYFNSSYGFVTRLDAQFNVTASTLLAGESGDNTLCLAAAPGGNIFAGGSTYSKAFPLRGAAQGSFASGTGFLTELSGDLSSVLFSTFAGDTRSFSVRTLAPTADGGVVFGGSTFSPPLQAFVVKAMPQPAMPRIDSVVNAASRLGVALSPGETFLVNGAGFGADAVLLLNGAPLPLIAQDSVSLTAALPLDFTASGGVTVSVQSGSATSNPFLAPFLPTGPGIFSADGSGQGRAYILNADGTLNSPTNPTKAGAEITIYATGVGHMTFTQGYAVTDSPVIVAVAGFGAPGIAAVYGPVDGFPGNVYRISVYMPNPAAFASSNPNLANFAFAPMTPITIQVNGVTSQNGLWVAVE